MSFNEGNPLALGSRDLAAEGLCTHSSVAELWGWWNLAVSPWVDTFHESIMQHPTCLWKFVFPGLEYGGDTTLYWAHFCQANKLLVLNIALIFAWSSKSTYLCSQYLCVYRSFSCSSPGFFPSWRAPLSVCFSGRRASCSTDSGSLLLQKCIICTYSFWGSHCLPLNITVLWTNVKGTASLIWFQTLLFSLEIWISPCLSSLTGTTINPNWPSPYLTAGQNGSRFYLIWPWLPMSQIFLLTLSALTGYV